MKKIEFFVWFEVRFGVRSGNGSTIPGSGSVDPDPHQNEVDQKHCFKESIILGLSQKGLTWKFTKLQRIYR